MKILIGCPTYERYRYCVDLWIKQVKEIQEFSKEHQIDYLLADNSPTDDFYNELKEKNINVIKAPYFSDVRERVIYSRNLIREKFLNEGYDFFFSLEQDVIPPKDIIENLLKHNKEIVSAYYNKLVKVGLKDNETGEVKNALIELALVWVQADGEKIRRANPQEVLNKGLIKVGGFGIGCVLIKREVLEKIKFEYKPDKKAFDDMLFCDDAEKAGYGLFLDSNIKVPHLHKQWDRDNV
jgi:hypothetical protein